MFGRTRHAAAAAAPGSAGRIQHVLVPVPEADTANINRYRGLVGQIGAGLQGGSGYVIGYDRGDPAHSLNAVIPVATTPTAAIADVSRPADAALIAPTPQWQNMVSTGDPGQDAYQVALFQRIAR